MNERNPRHERAIRVYGTLLRLYPRHHRDAFGAQMLQTFKDQYRDVAAERGGVGVAFWLGVISDEVRGIAREQIVSAHVRRILLMLMLLGATDVAAIAVFGPRLKYVPALLIAILVIFPVLAILSAILLVAILAKNWVKKWQIVAVIFLAVSVLGIFGVQGAVRATGTNTWCTTTHTASSQPPATLTTAADYFTQGDYEYDRGDCNAAIVAYTVAITLNPAFAEAYNNRAYTYMMQQEYAHALPDLDRAIQLRPDYAHALMNRGDIYNYYYQIDRARAVADYDRVIARGPEAMRDTSVCGHRLLAVHNGWHLSTILAIPRAAC